MNKSQSRSFLTIEGAYQDFAKHVMPSDASPIQQAEMKKTFYAGFASCLNSIDVIADFNNTQAVENLARLRAEALSTVGNVQWHQDLNMLTVKDGKDDPRH